MKNGFSAYPEINELAKKAFSGQDISVRGSMTGDHYVILISHKEVMKGTTEEIRKQLNDKLEGIK